MRNAATGFATLVTGTGFSSNPLSNPTGTVTGMVMVIRDPVGMSTAQCADFAWSAAALQDAHFRILGSSDATGLVALFRLEDVSIDASSRTDAIRPEGAFTHDITSDRRCWATDASGAGLIVIQSQKMTVADRAMAETKVFSHRSLRVAMRRQSFRRPKMISIRLRLFILHRSYRTGLPHGFLPGMQGRIALSFKASRNQSAS